MGVCLPRNKNFIASLTTLCCESGKEIPAGATGYENAAARMNEYSVEIVRIFARLIRFREEKGVYRPTERRGAQQRCASETSRFLFVETNP